MPACMHVCADPFVVAVSPLACSVLDPLLSWEQRALPFLRRQSLALARAMEVT
jgi:hypothetical protein